MMITSCIDGRIRVRDSLLRNASVAGTLNRVLLDAPGVKAVSINSRAGSLLILFRQAQTTVREIIALLEEFLPAAKTASAPVPAKSGRSRQVGLATIRRRAVNLGMLASLLVSLLGAALGAKTLHIVAGIIFVAVAGVHHYDKRQALFA